MTTIFSFFSSNMSLRFQLVSLGKSNRYFLYTNFPHGFGVYVIGCARLTGDVCYVLPKFEIDNFL